MDDILARVTPDGRRLCFDNEVKKEIIQGKVTRAVLVPPIPGSEYTKKIIAADVDSIENESGSKVGLSKARFAELIFQHNEPFADVDFSPFGLVANQIELILAVSH